jgi:transcriptional regulator with XRE-family HTH domain
MSDIFTLQTVPLTPDIGMALKNFRIENKITAKSITEKFDRASSYISKLEKGDIKKIDGDFLIELCNFITGSDDGLDIFLSKLSQSYKDFTNESKTIIMNIDDLLYEYTVPSKMLDEINGYIKSHNISISTIVETINLNKDIADRDNYNDLPLNIWYSPNDDIDNAAIKMSVPLSYVEDLLSGKIVTIHRVIAEVILYAMYTCGNEKNARDVANDKLKLYHIIPRRSVITLTPDNIENIFGGLEPDTSDALKDVIMQLRLITTVTKEYGSKRIKQICSNLGEDLGFCFAYMSLNLVELEQKDKEKKKEFLNELKSLIDKYSKEDSGIDLYE